MTVTTAVVVLPRRMAVWATRRALARTSLTGIGLACSLCAAVWFSAGTRGAALAGGAALGAGYLARRIGGQLAATAFDAWLAGLGALAGEIGVYAALAVGAGGHRIDWELATAAAALLGTRAVARRCRETPSAQSAPWPTPGRPGPARAMDGGPTGPGAPGGPGGPGRIQAVTEGVGSLLAVPSWVRAIVITAAAASYGPRAALAATIWAGSVGLAWLILTAPRQPGRGPVALGARDDGPVARFAGSVVRGQLAPLPPAVAGLAATVLLTVLGLHGLAGLVLLTPVAAMLLAAPGSAHPHNGPADWLAPAVIQAGEYAYLAALGFTKGVPSPVTCCLIGLIALRQLDVAQVATRPGTLPGRPSGPGWDGRMLAAGFGAMLGLAIFSYLALAVYLAWQLGCAGLSGWAAALPPDRRSAHLVTGAAR
jgi:Family of unknown function (DUF5941)